MASPSPNLLSNCLQARARSLHAQGKSPEVIARALGVTPNVARRLIENRPTELRRVSPMSLIIPGEVVEVLGGIGDQTGHTWVQGTRGRYSIPKDLLERFEPLLEPVASAPVSSPEAPKKPGGSEQAMQRRTSHTKALPEQSTAPLRRGNTEWRFEPPSQHTPSTTTEPMVQTIDDRPTDGMVLLEQAMQVRTSHASKLKGAPVAPKPLTPADLTPEQRDRWRQSLPTIKEQESGSSDDDKQKTIVGGSNLPIVGGQLVKTEDGRELIVARDGTFRHAGTDAYRGLRAIAAEQTLKKRIPTGVKLRQNGNMIEVTLVQPSRREAGDIRRSVVAQLIETHLDSEFLALAHKLRATRAEKNLAERVIALRHVGMDHDGREIRDRVGVTIKEIRSV